MSNNATDDIIINKAETTKIGSVDFENLVFGNTFTDHMLICDYKQGVWEKPVIKPYEPFLIDPSAKVFHYGQAIFEGLKAYRSDEGKVLVFRPSQVLKSQIAASGSDPIS